jgi:hypothetical protein
MAITLTQPPPFASAKLEPADVASLFAALSPLITLPENESWINVVALNVNVGPDGAASFNVRFKQ